MKKIYFLFLTLFCLAIIANAQWTVYDGSIPPTTATPAWTTGDVGSPPAVYSILDDPFISGNKIVFETTSASAEKMTYKLAGTRPVSGTWAFRTKAGNNDASMEFEIHGLDTIATPDSAYRLNLRLYSDPRGGYLKLQYAATGTSIYPADSAFDVKNWHTYRITIENGREFNVYIDEDPSPVLSVTGTYSTNSQILRVGDIGSTFTEGYLDWMIWNFATANAPGEGDAIPDSLSTSTNKGEIAFITDDLQDSVFIKTLTSEGYGVHVHNWTDLSLQPLDTINMLNNHNLVVIGRSLHSSGFTSDIKKYSWNTKITVPLLAVNPYIMAKERIGWFNVTNSAGAYHSNTNTDPPAGDTIEAQVLLPDDLVFKGITLSDGDTLKWSVKPDDLLRIKSVVTNGTILAQAGNDTTVLFVRFDAGTEFYPGAGVNLTPAAPRTFFGFGNDNLGYPHFFPITDDTKTVLLAEIERLINTKYTVFKSYLSDTAWLSDITTDAGSLDPDFAPGTIIYTVNVPSVTDSITIDAIPASLSAIVTGTGKFDLSGGSDTITINVISANGIFSRSYTVMVYVLSDDATLSGLTADVGSLVPAFNPDVEDYALEVPSATSSLTLTAVKNQDGATVEGDGLISAIPSTVNIVVTSEDVTTQRTYTVVISKLPSSLNELVDGTFMIYPNPIEDKMVIESKDIIQNISIYNVAGKELINNEVNTNFFELNTSKLKSGIYFVKIQMEIGVTVKKITKN